MSLRISQCGDLCRMILGARRRWKTASSTIQHYVTQTRHQTQSVRPPDGLNESSSSTLYTEIDGKRYHGDSWTNVPPSILASLPRHLHLQPSHPISLTRQLIESRFPSPDYIHYNDLSPIVSVSQNFDSLGFPADHPGRSRTDTYYLNKETVLRTHTSAHQAEIFRKDESEGYTISADVYRRDAIDRSHYPIFHQMEGARMWDRRRMTGGDIAKAVLQDLQRVTKA